MKPLVAVLCLGCTTTVYEDSDTEPPPPDTQPVNWDAVSAAFDAAAPDAPPTGMTLIVWNGAGEVLYRRTAGGFEPDVNIPVASASKLVSGLVLLRLVHQGELALDDTTGEVLGWDGENAAITLDQLGAFASGFEGTTGCVFNVQMPLSECAAQLEDRRTVAGPGERFDYNSLHMLVAGAMAEERVGSGWNDLFTERLAEPLGLQDPALTYYSYPKQRLGSVNPLVAGGLSTTTEQYGVFLRLVLNEGTHDGEEIIAPALIDRLFENRYVAAEIGESPAQNAGLDYRYSFGAWLECTGKVDSCDVAASAGSFGFVPWVDRSRKYAAVLAMEGEGGSVMTFGLPVQQQLRAEIDKALDGAE